MNHLNVQEYVITTEHGTYDNYSCIYAFATWRF